MNENTTTLATDAEIAATLATLAPYTDAPTTVPWDDTKAFVQTPADKGEELVTS